MSESGILEVTLDRPKANAIDALISRRRSMSAIRRCGACSTKVLSKRFPRLAG